jgi:hypothetical protein
VPEPANDNPRPIQLTSLQQARIAQPRLSRARAFQNCEVVASRMPAAVVQDS